MAVQRVNISDLTPHTVTRTKGNVAYKHLDKLLEHNQQIEIYVSGDIPLSVSFLDELTRLVADAGQLDQVIFAIEDRDALRKLSRIAGIREIDIRYSGVDTSSPRKVSPLFTTNSEVIVAGTKPTDDDL